MLKRRTESVKCYNARVALDSQLPVDAEFYKVVYSCTHAGKIISRGLNANRRHMATGCPFQINLKYNRFLQKVVVVSINLDHQGHDISPEIYASIYPQNRKISKESKEYIDSTLTLKPNTQALKRIIQDQNPGKVILRKDIQNLIQQAKRQKNSSNEEDVFNEIVKIKNEFEQVNGNVFAINSDENILNYILILSKDSIELFDDHHDVLMLDGTHKTNKHNLPLYIMMAQDSLGLGRIIGFAFVRNETKNMLMSVLKTFKNVTKKEIKTIVVDKDLQEIDAIKEVYPMASVKLCVVHCLRAFWKALSNHRLSRQDKNNLGGIFRSMCFDINHGNYILKLQQLKAECPDPQFICYFQANWECCAQMWAGYGIKNTVTYGNNSNNRIESKNQKIKFYLDKSDNLANSINKLIKYMAEEKQEMDAKINFISNTMTPITTKDAQVERLVKKYCSPKALRIYQKNKKEEYRPSIEDSEDKISFQEEGVSIDKATNKCDCRDYLIHQLPCCHITFACEENLISFSIDHLSKQWLIPQSISKSSSNLINSNYRIAPVKKIKLNPKNKFLHAKTTVMETASLISRFSEHAYHKHIQFFEFVNKMLKKNPSGLIDSIDTVMNVIDESHNIISGKTDFKSNSLDENQVNLVNKEIETKSTNLDALDCKQDSEQICNPNSDISNSDQFFDQLDNLDTDLFPIDEKFEISSTENQILQPFLNEAASCDEPVFNQDLPRFSVPDIVSRGRPSGSNTSSLFYKPPKNQKSIEIDPYLKPLVQNLSHSDDYSKYLNDKIIHNFCSKLALNTYNETIDPLAPLMTNKSSFDGLLNKSNESKILIPTNKDNIHWYLIIIEKNIASVYDSMGSDCMHSKITLEKIFNNQSLEIKPVIVPHQTNSWSCGIYTCLFAYKVCVNQNINEITPSMMLNFREYMFAILTEVPFSKFCSNCFIKVPRNITKCASCSLVFCKNCYNVLKKTICPQCQE